jgi:hypothetical protein
VKTQQRMRDLMRLHEAAFMKVLAEVSRGQYDDL